jgi:hypothetical protein
VAHSPIAARDLAPASTAATPRPACAAGRVAGWVGELGEVIEQISALVGCQGSGHGQPLGNRCNGDDEQAGTASGLVVGLETT